MTSLKIEYVDVSALVPMKGNPRKNEQAIPKVADSIKRFGWTNPVLARREDNVVIAGHTRLAAAKSMGVDKVPVIWLDLDPVSSKLYNLADNKLNEVAEWDEESLEAMLRELQPLDEDGLIIAGFEDELKALIDDANKKEESDNEIVVPEKAITKKGMVWKLGNHRLMCGDATSKQDMHKLTNGILVDMWITDPPYNVSYEGKTKDALKIKNDSMTDEDFRIFLRESYRTADMVMKPGAVFYIWHAYLQSHNFILAAKDIEWNVRQILIWNKSVFAFGRHDYHWKHEPCIYGWKDGSAHLWCNDRKQTTVLEFNKPSKNLDHPTMKPVELFEYQILNNTNQSALILDSFAGSGTTLIACQKNNRTALLMELDEKYVDVIIHRWQVFTGEKAILESTGETFDSLSMEAGHVSTN